MGITLCNEDNVFFPSDFIYCKHNTVTTEKRCSPIYLCVTSIFGFSKGCNVSFVGDLKHQLLEVINHFHGRRSELRNVSEESREEIASLFHFVKVH